MTNEWLEKIYDRLNWTNIWLFLILLHTCGDNK